MSETYTAPKQHFWSNWGRYFSTGASYMIPVVLIGGFASGIATLAGCGPTCDVKTANPISVMLYNLGNDGMGLFVSVLAAFIAYAIADKAGIAPGLVVGYFAVQLGTGFLGALIAGFLVGYTTKALIQKVHVPSWLVQLWVFFVPVIVAFVYGAVFQWIIGPPLTWLTNGLTNWLTSMSNSGVSAAILGMIIGAMAGLDAGGPINKVAFFFALGALSSNVYGPMGMFMSASAVPSIGLGVAALLAGKVIKNRVVFTEDEHTFAAPAILLGVCTGFSEGAIPFLVNDIIRVAAASAIGCAVSSGMAGAFGLTMVSPNSAILGAIIVSNPLEYILCILVGSAVTCALVIIFKAYIKPRKDQLVVPAAA
jgi:fructose-specific phosphotransferase system IIC component